MSDHEDEISDNEENNEITDESQVYEPEEEINNTDSDLIKRRKIQKNDESDEENSEVSEEENEEQEEEEEEVVEQKHEPKRKVPAAKTRAQESVEAQEVDDPESTNEVDQRSVRTKKKSDSQVVDIQQKPAVKEKAKAVLTRQTKVAQSKSDQDDANRKQSYEEMVIEAIESNGKLGMSLASVKKYLHGKYKADNVTAIKKVLLKALDDGHLKKKSGIGFIGTFLIDPNFGKKKKVVKEKEMSPPKKSTKKASKKDTNNNAKAVISKTTKIKKNDGKNIRLSIGATTTRTNKKIASKKKLEEPKEKVTKKIAPKIAKAKKAK